MAEYKNWNVELATQIVQNHSGKSGTLICALQDLQKVFGYVDDEAISILALAYNLSRAEVHGVRSFYHDFRNTKPGKHTVKVCQAEACQAMGSRLLTDEIKTYLKVDFHQTSESGDFTLEPVYCLGNCACSPSVMIGDRVHGRVDIDRFKSLAQQAVKEASHD